MLSKYSSACVRIESRLPWMPASAPLCRALPSDTRTIAAKMPMMAMTTKSSMRVKPRIFMLLIVQHKIPAPAGIVLNKGRRLLYGQVAKPEASKAVSIAATRDCCALPLLSTHHALVLSLLSGMATTHVVCAPATAPATTATQRLAELAVPASVARPELLLALMIAALMVASFHISTPPPHAAPATATVALPFAAGTAVVGLYLLLLLLAYISVCVRIESRLPLMPASAPCWRALPSDTSTIAAKMPMMEMTTKSSIRVKPLLIIFCIDNSVTVK